MLSALSHHLTKLEEKLDDQEQEINSLKLRDSFCDCSSDINSLRNQVNDNKAKIDDILRKFEKFANNGSLKSNEADNKIDFAFSPQTLKYDDRNHPSGLAIAANGHQGNNQQALRFSPSEFFSSFSNYQVVEVSHGSNPCAPNNNPSMKPNQPVTSIDGLPVPARGPNMPPKSMPAWSFKNDAVRNAPSPRKGQLIPTDTPGADITLDNIRAIAAENSGLRNQVAMYRKKVEGLEQALAARDVAISDLRAFKEHYAHREREWEQRQDWLDHKMKLLKQDKRRRGETIGKLLKVIDDLKDNGRLDENKVKDGRAVLSMTLQTKDLPHEERVSRVVDAVEFDRVPRCPVVEPNTGTDTPILLDGCYGNENGNNSSRNCVDCCNCTCSGKVDFAAIADSRRHDYVPIPFTEASTYIHHGNKL